MYIGIWNCILTMYTNKGKSNKGIYTTPIRSRLQGKMDALNASVDLLKSQLLQLPPPPFNAGATYHSICVTFDVCI